ncbi:MAG: class I SAM-dependent methyltransferase, partial [Candidatus Woesearchaeota archaeon]
MKHLHAHGGYWLLYPDVTHIYPDKSSWQKLEALCPSSFRILLAGCGTDEPLLFALLHRQAYIDAVDLSEQSLKFAKRRIRLARFLGLLQGQNITFHVADVCEHVQTASQKYHYIQCFGVLHHQPCPQKFFFTLAEALETGGIFRLMFYPQSSRKLERGLQKRFASVWECMPSKNFKNLLTLYWHALLLWSWLCMQRLFCMRWSRRFRYLHLRPTCVSDALLHPSDFSVALTDILIWAQAAHLQLKFIAS